jgi:uncharacterized protein (TIGR02996 family)
MSEDAAFRAAIQADPTAVATRLVYADWLDEHGRPEYASFLRAQCELAVTPADSSDYLGRARTAAERLCKSGSSWKEMLPTHPGLTFPGVQCPQVIWCDVQMWWRYKEHAAVLFAGAPILGLRFRDLNDRQCGELAASPWLARVTHLDLSGCRIGSSGAAALIGSPSLGNLSDLAVAGCGIEDWGMIALAGALGSGRVMRAVVSGNPITRRALDALTHQMSGRFVFDPTYT